MVCDPDGSLSSSEFKIAANAFAEMWKKFNSAFPEWSWIDCSDRVGILAHGYLSLENVLFQRFPEEEQDKEAGLSDKEEESYDDATLVESVENGHEYQFHVVYSHSYRVPVLYFRAYTSDGQPLNLDEIEKDLPTKSAKMSVEAKWTFITQEEHPYLNRPWFTLHPCGTSEWMTLLLAGAKSGTEGYLASWFSVVGQVFGLRLPFHVLKSIS